MKPGTPGFAGARLREARESRGLNGIALADLIGVKRQSISQYENGLQTPSPTVMAKICAVLGFSMQFFLRQPSVEDDATIFYRSMSSATKTQRLRAERRYGWLREIVRYLTRFIEFPAVQFPEFDLPSDPVTLTASQIDEFAERTRRHWGLGDGPISNIARLLENKGAIVVRHELGAATLDAFSQWSKTENRPYIVLGDDKDSAVRSRFDAAHELAHMVLHQRVHGDDLRKGARFKMLEEQANQFASAFLLPASTFAHEFTPSLNAMIGLKERWGTAIGCVIMRAQRLRIISEDHASRLWMRRSRRQWQKREPLDDTLVAEEPRFLSKCFNLLLSKGVIDPDEISLQLSLPAADIESVCRIEGVLVAANEQTVKLRGCTADFEPHILQFSALRQG
jgi:Zn-dependent peptidase ImmA (M78 family)/DNA-binding XRE family transcriptional regulator